MSLNKKGFTLVELLAVVIILSVIVAIMVPGVNYLIERNRNDNYKALKNGILSASKIYLSDNRYNVGLNYGEELCSDDEIEESIGTIGENNLIEDLGASKLPIRILVNNKVLTTNSDGNIINPMDKSQNLDLDNSYVLVKYQCSNKDYVYSIEDDFLIWE